MNAQGTAQNPLVERLLNARNRRLGHVPTENLHYIHQVGRETLHQSQGMIGGGEGLARVVVVAEHFPSEIVLVSIGE